MLWQSCKSSISACRVEEPFTDPNCLGSSSAKDDLPKPLDNMWPFDNICVNSLRPRPNRRHVADDVFKCIFLNENVWIPIKISLKFVPKGPINNIPALVQIMAWRRSGDKPLSEPMMVNLPTHICVTRPQWVKLIGLLSLHTSSVVVTLCNGETYAVFHTLLILPSLMDEFQRQTTGLAKTIREDLGWDFVWSHALVFWIIGSPHFRQKLCT